MVTRKPIPTRSSLTTNQNDSNALPYPITPTLSNWPNVVSNPSKTQPVEEKPHSIPNYPEAEGSAASSYAYPEEIDNRRLRGSNNKKSSNYQQLPWPDVGDRISGTVQARQEDLPTSLRVHQPDLTPRSSSESQRSQGDHTYTSYELPKETNHYSSLSTNPYHRTKGSESSQPEVVQSTEDSSSDIWAELASYPPPPVSDPPPIPLPLPQGEGILF